SDRRYLEMERQYRHRHRQLPDAFAVDVGADHAITVDGDPRCVAPRDLRVREIAAVAEVGDDLGQAFPATHVADQDQVELAVAGVGAGREHQAFARAVEAAQHQGPHRQVLFGLVVDPDTIGARTVGQRRERRHQDITDRAEPFQERDALCAPGNRGGGADDREHEAITCHLVARIALGVGAEYIDRAEMLFEFGANLRPALAATGLVRHRIDYDPGFHGYLRNKTIASA